MSMTVAWITARSLFGRRRFLLLFPLPALLIVLTLAAKAAGSDPSSWANAVIDGLGFTVLLPITALITGTGVLGSEIEDGTIVHILTKPIARGKVILAKLCVAAGVTTLVTAIPMFLVGAAIYTVQFGLALALGCLVGSLAYSALFLTLSLVTRRPVLIGLGYVLLWEGLLGSLVDSIANVSIGQYSRAIAAAADTDDLIDGHVGVGVAIVMSAVFLIGGTLFAIDRLRSLTLRGETS